MIGLFEIYMKFSKKKVYQSLINLIQDCLKISLKL